MGFVKHSPDINKDDIAHIIATLNPDDNIQLQCLTLVYVMLFYCRRGIENLAGMEKDDLEIVNVNGQDSYHMKSKKHIGFEQNDSLVDIGLSSSLEPEQNDSPVDIGLEPNKYAYVC